LDSTICAAMSGNGALMRGMRIIRERQSMAVLG
jgi:hypothetical protein